jgi:hypothetical protein
MPTVGGSKFADIQIPRLSEIDYAVSGKPFTDSTQAGVFGIRKAAKITFPTQARTDAIGKEQTDAKKFEMDFELWQDDYTALFRMYNLCQTAQQLRIKTAGGDTYNLVKNAGTMATPTGSTEVGCEVTYEVDMTNIALKLKYSGKMAPLEYDWMLTNATGNNAGATGGTSIAALTQMVYSQSEYGIPGINNILWASDDAGELENPKLTIHFKKTQETTRNIPIVKMAEVTLEYDMLQSRYYDLQVNAGHRNADFTTTVNLWNGTIFVFVNSISLVDTPTLGDDKTFIHVVQKGMIPFDAVGAAQSNITFNAGTKTITFARVGYA